MLQSRLPANAEIPPEAMRKEVFVLLDIEMKIVTC
jgi:hypothetical protein